MTDQTRKMLAQSFGIPINDPRMDAAMRTLGLARRDSDIYKNSGKVDTVDLALRYGITKRRCEQIIKEQLELRQAG